MSALRHEGYSYSVIVRPWKKGKQRHEIIKKKIGMPSDWCRVSLEEYNRIKELVNNKKK